MAVQHDRDIVVVADGWGQFAEQRFGDRVEGRCDGVRQYVGNPADSRVDRFVAPLDEPVGIEQ
jgi:hypothetical protein